MGVIGRCCRRLLGLAAGVRHALVAHLWARPPAAQVMGTGTDLLRRSVKRPVLTRTDRALLVLLVVQPDTLLRWHRAGFRAS